MEANEQTEMGQKRLRDDTAGMTLLHGPSMHKRSNQRSKTVDELLVHVTSKFKLHKPKVFSTALDAIEYAESLYEASCESIREGLKEFAAGAVSVADKTEHATYPLVAMHVEIRDLDRCRGKYAAYGVFKEPGFYGTTLTRFDVMKPHYLEQLSLLVERYNVGLVVGATNQAIPLPFVVNNKPHDISGRHQYELHESFTFPDITKIDDHVPNGTAQTNLVNLTGMKPLSLFSALRVDLGLQRLAHYCATSSHFFQGFILLTNYQRYIDEFITWGASQVHTPGSEYSKLIGPHDAVLADANIPPPTPNGQCDCKTQPPLPQMPAYHLVREDGQGISMVNIGVGPSNAKTITDHLAVLRPHCWMMLGHCAGLRVSQNLGDYVLAHAYVREDHVLDQDLPPWIPLPPIAEVQTALEQAVASVLGESGVNVKSAMRTGTLLTTDNRDWELRATELRERFKQSRAIGVDMESATIAAQGYRFRVPYGTLLCVSDKPIHGELKLQGMANEFYRQRVAEHLRIGLDAVRLLRDQGVHRLQSRKLRGFDEPPFR